MCIDRIEQFVAKTDCSHISIIVDLQKIGSSYHRQGYRCNIPQLQQDTTPLSGIRSFPAIFSYPRDPPIEDHWPNIISVVYAHADYLNKFKDPLVFFDKKIQCTYFISKLEPCVILVAIYDKKKDNDSTILEFLNNIQSSLRLHKVTFSKLLIIFILIVLMYIHLGV
jgi:hypothetical protein